MLDLPNCRSLIALQTLLLLSLFCLHHAQSSETYSYCSLALTCALQMGMHRNLSLKASPVELEARKRTFFTIRKLEIYIGAILGLPTSLRDEDVDQIVPLEVDDEFITDAGIRHTLNVSCRMAIANAHSKLVDILPAIVNLTPQEIRDTTLKPQPSTAYKISERKLREVERRLQTWSESLPKYLWPGSDPSSGQLEK